jgi:hypothetical protein
VQDPACAQLATTAEASEAPPYRFEILRQGNTQAAKGVVAQVTCNALAAPWKSQAMAQALDADRDGHPDPLCQ